MNRYITPPSLSYFLFRCCFSMLSLSLEKLLTCGVFRSYNSLFLNHISHMLKPGQRVGRQVELFVVKPGRVTHRKLHECSKNGDMRIHRGFINKLNINKYRQTYDMTRLATELASWHMICGGGLGRWLAFSLWLNKWCMLTKMGQYPTKMVEYPTKWIQMMNEWTIEIIQTRSVSQLLLV